MIFVLSFFAFAFIPELTGLPETYFRTGWQPNITTFVFSAVIYVFQAWAIVMTAWIFSKAFLKTEASETEAVA